MSGFVAGSRGPKADSPIITDPFWPSVDLENMRETLRIDGSVTGPRLEAAAVAATISVNRELKAWRIEQQGNGYVSLVDVPGDLVNGESEFIHLYRRAIYAATGAEITERYRSYDATQSGRKSADEELPNIDEYRRDQRWAISDLLGQRRTTVELI